MSKHLSAAGITPCCCKSLGRLSSASGAALLFVATATVAVADEAEQGEALLDSQAAPEISFDGLELVEGTRTDVVYLYPNADFSVFRRVAILEPHVSFQRNWLRDQNRIRRLNSSDMDRIKADLAALLKQVFTWTTYDAAFLDIPLPERVPATVRDRAYTSPIWYTP